MKKVLLILYLLVSPMIFAKSGDVAKEVSGLFVNKTDFTKKKNRKVLAFALIKNLSQLNEIIPKNSPADESWLKTEIHESKMVTQRQINYLSTSIFAKFWLKDRFNWMINNLNYAYSDSTHLKDEIIIWTDIGDFLHGESEMINDNFQKLLDNHIISFTKLSEITGMPKTVPQGQVQNLL